MNRTAPVAALLPGMVPYAPKRNTIVAILYLFLLALSLAVLPL